SRPASPCGLEGTVWKPSTTLWRRAQTSAWNAFPVSEASVVAYASTFDIKADRASKSVQSVRQILTPVSCLRTPKRLRRLHLRARLRGPLRLIVLANFFGILGRLAQADPEPAMFAISSPYLRSAYTLS